MSKLVAVGACSALAGAALATYVLRQNKQGANNSSKVGTNEDEVEVPPPEIEDEVWSRNKTFFGDDGFADIRGSFVVVVGLGGVGSHAAHMLARSGVGAMRVIDFDQVSLSSLNRHAVATLANVGRPKSEVLASRVKESVPWCQVDARASMFTAEHALDLLGPCKASSSRDPTLYGRKPDYVLDCIDDVNTKADLIAHCVKHGLKCITACGAGAKADPTRLHMGLLSDASRDPLAAKMRWKLKQAACSLDDVVAVYSSEQPRMKLLPLTDEQAAAPSEFGIADGFRTRVMPVLGTSPAIMGQAMAAMVLCALARQPFVPQPVATMSIKSRHKLAQHLVNRERKVFGNTGCVVDAEDVHFVVSELWRAKCAATSERVERVPMEITRWRSKDGDAISNYVLLQSHLCLKLDQASKDGLGPEAVFDAETVQRIDAKLATFQRVGERHKLH